MGYIDDATQLQGLITDIQLGAGPNGWEVARHARTKFANLPVVYVSGDSAADWTAEGVPCSIMLQKPYADAQILTAIASLLNVTGPLPRATDPASDLMALSEQTHRLAAVWTGQTLPAS